MIKFRHLSGLAGRLHAPLLHDSYRTHDDYFAKHTNYTKRAAQDMREVGKQSARPS